MASAWVDGARRSFWRSRNGSRPRSCTRGFWLRDELPEAHQLNFAPRVRTPVLMLNGRYDDFFPLEASQLPLFHLLGTPDEDKKHVLFEKGHGNLDPRDEIRESLDWLDKYLGPVRHN